MLRVTKGVTGGGVFQADRRGDIAAIALFQVLPVVGMHLENTAHPLVVVLVRIVDRRTRLDNP